jgi:twinkle protein
MAELSEAHAMWLEERKIPSELAVRMGIVSKGDAIAFPYSRNGVLSYWKLRKISEKRFWREPGSSTTFLWNEDSLTEPEPSSAPLVISEGEIDTLSFLTSGATHVVSVPDGAQLKKPGEGNIKRSEDTAFAWLWDGNDLKPGLKRFAKIILATDDDDKGRVLRDELAIRLGPIRCWFVSYPAGCKDANEVLVKHGEAALQDMLADAKPMLPDMLAKFSEIPSSADAPQFSLGWSPFDKHFMFVPPQLIVVTGKPNHGKSLWVLAASANLARLHGIKGAILQFEDSPERNRQDLIRYAKAHGIENPLMWVDTMFRTISPRADAGERDFNLEWLHEVIEEAATRHDCKYVVLDPWNECEHYWGRQDTEATYLNRALRELKRLCRRYQIAIIIVAHPTKEGGKSKTLGDADLYDINGGAVWNNKADIGVVVWCEDEPAKTLARLIKVAKSKDFKVFGSPGVVEMVFNPQRMTFSCKRT